MVILSLDDIVLEDDVRELIRPFFEHATASGEISFEHNWQWNAYCDIIYALMKNGEDNFISYEWNYDPLTKRSWAWGEPITVEQYLEIPKIYASKLRRYSDAIGDILKQCLDNHGLKERTGFGRNINSYLNSVIN